MVDTKHSEIPLANARAVDPNESEVFTALEEAHRAAARLDELVAILSDRLRPVRVESDPVHQPEDGGGVAAPPPRCPLSQSVVELVAKADRVADRVRLTLAELRI